MPKKILLIENDAAFADELSRSLEAAGFETRVSGDGKDALDLAREIAPDAIVLCVELPGMSGYLVCQKLKKDETLKTVPLVLTSTEATEETFEKHRTLKARADEYMLKPYEPAALLERLGALIGLPERAAPPGEREEEVVSLEEETGLEATAEGEPGEEIEGLDLQSLPDEPATGGGAEGDELKLLDEAFDGISVSPAPGADEAGAALDLELGGDRPVRADDVDAAAESLPDDEATEPADLGGLDDDADRALGALGSDDESLSPPGGEDESLSSLGGEAPASPPVRGASADTLRAAGIKVLDGGARARAAAPPPPRPGAAAAGGETLRKLEREVDDLRRRAGELAGRAEAAEAEARDARADLESAREETRAAQADVETAREETRAAQGDVESAREETRAIQADLDSAREEARLAQADVEAAREEARRSSEEARAAEADLANLRARLAEVEQRAAQAEEEARVRAEEAEAAAGAMARAEALEREVDELRTEILVARGEAEGARGEVEKRSAELRKRISELEAASAKNEERVVKAYQKIKSDEKIREKVRKALAIAQQLLDDGTPVERPPEKDRRPAAAGGRE